MWVPLNVILDVVQHRAALYSLIPIIVAAHAILATCLRMDQ